MAGDGVGRGTSAPRDRAGGPGCHPSARCRSGRKEPGCRQPCGFGSTRRFVLAVAAWIHARPGKSSGGEIAWGVQAHEWSYALPPLR
jgi:hypothetical protein